MSSEIWNAFDKNRQLLSDQILERDKFPAAYPEELYHLAVNVWVKHRDGDWLLMKRSAEKQHFPNVYEVGAGGSVFYGETSQEAAKRELMEETGLVATSIDYLFSFTEEGHRTHFDTYLALVDGDKAQIIYQMEETDAHIWVKEADLPDFLETHPVFENQKEQVLTYCQSESE